MKRGILIEINKQKATLLMKDGTFITVKIPKGKEPVIGKEYQTSYFLPKKRSLFVMPSVSLGMTLVVTFLLLSGVMPFSNKSAVAAYVSFDMNPSIEVGVDDNMKVIKVKPYNDVGEEIIKEYNLSAGHGDSIETFANKLISACDKEGYIEPDRTMLITTVKTDSKKEDSKADLDQSIDRIVKNAAVHYPVSITVTETNTNTREKAKKLGVSSGKYAVYKKLDKKNQMHVASKTNIKKIKIEDLEKNTATSVNDLKVVPHPRKIKPTNEEYKMTPLNNGNAAVQKKDLNVKTPDRMNKSGVKHNEEKKWNNRHNGHQPTVQPGSKKERNEQQWHHRGDQHQNQGRQKHQNGKGHQNHNDKQKH